MNTGVEGTNGATCDAGMGIDSPGGTVDGARGEVNMRVWGCDPPVRATLPSFNTEGLSPRTLGNGVWVQCMCGCMHKRVVCG